MIRENICWYRKDDHDALVREISSVQSLSRVRLFVTPWIAAHQASLSITNSWSLLKLMSIESVMPSSHLILCCCLLLLPPIPPRIRVFSNESTQDTIKSAWWASLMAQMVKNLPAVQEIQVWPLGQEDPLEKGIATHSSILAWRIPWTEEPGGLQSMRSHTVGHNWVTNTHTQNVWYSSIWVKNKG